MIDEPKVFRNGMVCAVVFVACWLLAYPFANLAFEDDWAYARTALDFAHTGQLHYFGWGAPMLGWQAIWGAFFIRLFTFSFDILRISTLVLAIGTAVVFQAILERLGIHGRSSIVGVLTLVLSPLFLPLSASFMTDISGLFCVLLCLYLCLRAIAATSDQTTIAWLALAAVTNDIGGTVRQVIWLGVLVMVPSAAWLLRKRRFVLLVTAVLWGVSGLFILACMRWFSHQPYAVSDPSIGHSGNQVARIIVNSLSICLCTGFLILPILSAWLPRAKRLSRASLFRISLVLALVGGFMAATRWLVPWMPDIVTTALSLEAPGRGKIGISSLSAFTMLMASLLVVGCGLIFVESIAELNGQLQESMRGSEPWRAIGWLLGPFSLVYLGILLGYGYKVQIVDRHLLLIVPLTIIVLLRLYQEHFGPELPGISIAFVVLLAGLSIAGTHDWFAAKRARIRAIDRILADGVLPTAIQGGFEYDGWTQLESGGRATREVGDLKASSNPGITALRETSPCTDEFMYAPIVPSIHARYFVSGARASCLPMSTWKPVRYSAWLPPFRRAIYVQELPKLP